MRGWLGIYSVMLLGSTSSVASVLPWNSQNHYRIPLTVDPKAVKRSNCPAAVDIDFSRALSGQGTANLFD
jgi:hypothetical protein